MAGRQIYLAAAHATAAPSAGCDPLARRADAVAAMVAAAAPMPEPDPLAGALRAHKTNPKAFATHKDACVCCGGVVKVDANGSTLCVECYNFVK